MILVTGASGLLGFNFLLAAASRGKEVVGLYNKHPVRIAGAECLGFDLRDTAAAQGLLRRYRPQWLVHCAAIADVDFCQENRGQALRFNAEVSAALAAAAEENRARFVYISTDAVFDGSSGNYSEEDIPHPLNVYAESKLCGEGLVRESHEAALIVRTNIFGWNIQEKKSLAEWVIARLQAGKAVPGFRDVFFNPLLANDLSEILLDMMGHDLSGLYNVAGSEQCSKYEFALRLADVFALDKALVNPVSVLGAGLKAPRPKNTTLQTRKVSLALNREMPDIGSGMERLKALRTSGAFLREKRGL